MSNIARIVKDPTLKVIQATEVGRKLIQSLPETLTLPDITAQWEMQLSAISEKQQSYNGFVGPLQIQLTNIILQAISDGPQALKDLPVTSNPFKNYSVKSDIATG